MDRTDARKVFLGFNLVFGMLFLFAPRLSLRLYGLDPDRERAAALALRYFGSRSLLVAALLADDDTADAVLQQLPLVAAGDAVAVTAAAITGETPRRTALLGGVTSAVTLAIGWQARD